MLEIAGGILLAVFVLFVLLVMVNAHIDSY